MQATAKFYPILMFGSMCLVGFIGLFSNAPGLGATFLVLGIAALVIHLYSLSRSSFSETDESFEQCGVRVCYAKRTIVMAGAVWPISLVEHFYFVADKWRSRNSMVRTSEAYVQILGARHKVMFYEANEAQYFCERLQAAIIKAGGAKLPIESIPTSDYGTVRSNPGPLDHLGQR
jgi:hypothetical protein